MINRLWTCEKHAETFQATTIDDAICEWIESLGPVAFRALGTVTVYGYEPDALDLSEEWIAETAREMRARLLEELDDEYASASDGDHESDGCSEEECLEQCRLLREVVRGLLAKYQVYNCHEAETVTVNVEAWIAKYPDVWAGYVKCSQGFWGGMP